MKIIVEREPLMSAISAAARVAEKWDTIPILSHVLLKPNGHSLGIVGNNLDLQVETSCPAEISANGGANHGNIAVLAAPLDGLIKRAAEGAQIVIEYDDPAKGAVVKAGRSRYTFRSLPADDFPAFPDMKDSSTFALPSVDLAAALSKTRFAINASDPRAYCQGAHFHPSNNLHAAFGKDKKECLALVATDGHCLVRLALSVDGIGKNFKAPIISDFTIAEIIHLLDDDKDEVRVSVSQSLISVECAAGTLTSKLIDATYPEYERVVPQPGAYRMIADCKDIVQALERLRLVESAHGAAFNFADGVLKITIQNVEKGDAVEEIPIKWQGDPITVGLSAHCMLELFAAMKADQCVVSIADPNSAVLIQPWRAGAIDTSQTFLRMPMKL